MNLFDEQSTQLIRKFAQCRYDDFLLDKAGQEKLAKEVHQHYSATIYPPLILAMEGSRQVSAASEALLELIGHIPDLLFNGSDENWVASQGFVGAEADFFIQQLRLTARKKTLAVARADALVTTDGFKFVEMNISPALGGLGVCDGYSSRLWQSRLLGYLAQEGIEIDRPSVDKAWLLALRSLFWDDYPLPEKPLFFEVIANPDEKPEDAFDRPEWIDGLKRAGFIVMTGHLSQLQLTSSGVFVGGRRIDILYFCFTYQEMLKYGIDAGLISALTQADKDGLVNLFTSFATIPYDNKVNFAFLTDDQNKKYFSSSQLELIDKHIPKSHILARENIAFAKTEKNNLILKAGADFGGASIFIGENISNPDWDAALQKALSSGRPYILQEHIKNSWITEDMCGNRNTVCIAPMLFDAKAAGILLRTSRYAGRTEVVNVAQGSLFGTAFVRRPE